MSVLLSLQIPGSPHIEQISSSLSRLEASHFNILLHGSQKNMTHRLFRLTLSGIESRVSITARFSARWTSVRFWLTFW